MPLSRTRYTLAAIPNLRSTLPQESSPGLLQIGALIRCVRVKKKVRSSQYQDEFDIEFIKPEAGMSFQSKAV